MFTVSAIICCCCCCFVIIIIINRKMIGVAITPDSRREWRSRGATRYWIVAPGRTDIEIKKPSPAHRQIAEWSFLPEDLRSHKPTTDRTGKLNLGWRLSSWENNKIMTSREADAVVTRHWSSVHNERNASTIASCTSFLWQINVEMTCNGCRHWRRL